MKAKYISIPKFAKGTWVLVAFLFFLVFLGTGTHAQSKVFLNIGLLNDPKNLNPFKATDAWTKKVISLIYQPLYRIDSTTMTLIPWLAENQPVYDPVKKTVTFRLREMGWDDGTPFTAEDVVFTVSVFKKFKVPRYYAFWKFVNEIKALDARTIQMRIERPMAILSRRSLTTWIVQKKSWAPVVERAEKRIDEVLSRAEIKEKDQDEAIEIAVKEALRVIQSQRVERPIGLGPFKFKERKRGKYILLSKNHNFFGQRQTINGRKLGPYIDRVIYKIYDTIGSATMALEKGHIDFLWKGVSHALVEALNLEPNINVPMALDSGYRYLGFNLRKAPMSDLSFRRAVAYLIDKAFIAERINHHHGARLDTLVPPENVFYFNPNTPVYGKGMNRERRIKEAYWILRDAGYWWEKPPLDESGIVRKANGLKMPNGTPVPVLNFLTPNAEYDTEMAASGKIIQKWLADFGIDVSWKPMAFSGLVKEVRSKRQFDLFLMGWRRLSVDPDYLRRFFHSAYDKPNQWNYPGYRNKKFDELADLQAQAIDPERRRKIILTMQARLMMDLPYIPLYVPHRMEGIRTDRFQGWTTQVGGVGNIWTFSTLRPTNWWYKSHPLHR